MLRFDNRATGSSRVRHKLIASIFLLSACWPLGMFSQQPERAMVKGEPVPPVRSVIDPGVIPSRQAITPAGVQSIFEGRVYGVTFGNDNETVFATTASRSKSEVYELNWKTNKVIEVFRTPGAPGMQSIVFDPSKCLALVTGLGGKKSKKDPPSVQLWQTSPGHGLVSVLADNLGHDAVGGIAVAHNANTSVRYGVVPLTYNDAASIVNLSDGSVLATVKTGIAPFGAVMNNAGTVAYVSNWGGRFPKADDRVAVMGLNPNDADQTKEPDRVVVDERGIVSNGTVSRLDVSSGKLVGEVQVGLHPTGLAWDESANRLYVANSNSDTISVVDTRANRLVDTIPLQPFRRNISNVSPESLVLSKDGRQLYVACAGINAIAVVTVGRGKNQVAGLIPTGWYPDHIVLSPNGHYLAVATLLGVGSGWRDAPENRFKGTGLQPGPTRRYVHSYRGTVQVVAVPDTAQLEQYTAVVSENNHLSPAPSRAGIAQNGVSPHEPIPSVPGETSPIRHVVYIIKENRSYDQYFGDLPAGNGDPSLQSYGDDIIPNQRALAREFVLLDNFYANGGNSGDGHQWVTQATETDYTYWPGYGGRSYPKNGDDPMAFANTGFLWSNVIAHRKSFEDFGEYAGFIIPAAKLMDRMKLLDEYKSGDNFSNRFHTKAPIAALDPYVAHDFPGYGLQIPDVVRAHIFLDHLKKWESDGSMPNLVMVQLPSDHTSGTTPGFSTPKACLADNDLAVGKIVDGISHSKFWKSTLILVVEDDAQDGLDHVDGHRTVALAVSPYIKRHSTDSTFYSQVSMVKTIERILGLPNLSLYDLLADDMRNSFTDQPVLEPYTAIVPKQSIYEANPPLESLTGQAKKDAIASAQMNWLVPDAAPTGKLNAILWRNARTGSAPPKTKSAAFAAFADSSGDDQKK